MFSATWRFWHCSSSLVFIVVNLVVIWLDLTFLLMTECVCLPVSSLSFACFALTQQSLFSFACFVFLLICFVVVKDFNCLVLGGMLLLSPPISFLFCLLFGPRRTQYYVALCTGVSLFEELCPNQQLFPPCAIIAQSLSGECRCLGRNDGINPTAVFETASSEGKNVPETQLHHLDLHPSVSLSSSFFQHHGRKSLISTGMLLLVPCLPICGWPCLVLTLWFSSPAFCLSHFCCPIFLFLCLLARWSFFDLSAASVRDIWCFCFRVQPKHCGLSVSFSFSWFSCCWPCCTGKKNPQAACRRSCCYAASARLRKVSFFLLHD